MKKTTSILLAVYFLIGSLTPKMDFQQLLHLACAAEHFAMHQSEAEDNGTSITIADFLVDHYLNPDNHEHSGENDHHEHPCTHSHNHTVDFAEIDLMIPSLDIAEDDLMVQNFSMIHSFYSADFTSGLEEPPSLS